MFDTVSQELNHNLLHCKWMAGLASPADIWSIKLEGKDMPTVPISQSLTHVY